MSLAVSEMCAPAEAEGLAREPPSPLSDEDEMTIRLHRGASGLHRMSFSSSSSSVTSAAAAVPAPTRKTARMTCRPMSPTDAMSPADVRLAKAIITDADINIRRKIGWKPTTPEADNKRPEEYEAVKRHEAVERRLLRGQKQKSWRGEDSDSVEDEEDPREMICGCRNWIDGGAHVRGGGCEYIRGTGGRCKCLYKVSMHEAPCNAAYEALPEVWTESREYWVLNRYLH
jgi:hypothetical protein